MNEENQNITRTSAVSWLFHQMGDRKGAFVMSVITALEPRPWISWQSTRICSRWLDSAAGAGWRS